MIIRWADHKAGFVRRQNFLMRGQLLLNPVFTVTTAAIVPIPVVPGVPGPIRLLTPWAAGQFWVNPDLTITQRARVWLNRVTGFEGRIGTIESELDVIDALLAQIQIDILANTVNITANADAITALTVRVTAIEADILSILSSIDTINSDISGINSRLDALEASGIVETNVDYQALPTDKIINCNGSVRITFPAITIAFQALTITSTTGNVTTAADVTIQSPTNVSTGTTSTFYPARGQWFHM